jgi:uncharacterized protein (DUF736 family)
MLKRKHFGGVMKESKVKFDEETFEEVSLEESKPSPSEKEGPVGARPDFRIVQADRDKNGNVVYVNVGGMWKNISKNGNEFYSMKIGNLKLLVFPNSK